jgi:hypothetical protein
MDFIPLLAIHVSLALLSPSVHFPALSPLAFTPNFFFAQPGAEGSKGWAMWKRRSFLFAFALVSILVIVPSPTSRLLILSRNKSFSICTVGCVENIRGLPFVRKFQVLQRMNACNKVKF